MELRRESLRGLISQIHAESRGVYGYRPIRAELRLGRQIVVSRKLVHKSMAEARLQGLPIRRQRKNLVNLATSDDLVCRNFTRAAPNQLWLTDITEHPTREGKVYCCVVLDARSRRVVGWSIDAQQASSLVTNALDGDRQPHTAGRDGHPQRSWIAPPALLVAAGQIGHQNLSTVRVEIDIGREGCPDHLADRPAPGRPHRITPTPPACPRELPITSRSRQDRDARPLSATQAGS